MCRISQPEIEMGRVPTETGVPDSEESFLCLVTDELMARDKENESYH